MDTYNDYFRWRRIGSPRDEDPILGARNSHFEAIKRGQKVRSNVFLVLEDDAFLIGDPKKIYSYCSALEKYEWDMLLLGYNYYIPNDEITTPRGLINVRLFTGTQAYIVNKKNIEKMLIVNSLDREPVDWSFSSMYLNIFALKEPLFIPDDTYGDISAGEFSDFHQKVCEYTRNKYLVE